MNVMVKIKKADGQVLKRVCCPFLEKVVLKDVLGSGIHKTVMCLSPGYCYCMPCPFVPERLT